VSACTKGYESRELFPSDTIFLNPSAFTLTYIACWLLGPFLRTFIITFHYRHSQSQFLLLLISTYGIVLSCSLFDLHQLHYYCLWPSHPPALRNPSSHAMFPAPNGLTSSCTPSEGSTLGPFRISLDVLKEDRIRSWMNWLTTLVAQTQTARA
jgi:hypothetical protein